MAAASFKGRSPSGAKKQSKDERGKEKGSLGQEVPGKSKPSPCKQLEEQASRAKQRQVTKTLRLERQEREAKQQEADKARIEAEKKKVEEERARKEEIQKKVSENRRQEKEEEYKRNQALQKERTAEKEEAKKAAAEKAAKEKAELEKKKKEEMGRESNTKGDEALKTAEKKGAVTEKKMHGANKAGYESL